MTSCKTLLKRTSNSFGCEPWNTNYLFRLIRLLTTSLQSNCDIESSWTEASLFAKRIEVNDSTFINNDFSDNLLIVRAKIIFKPD